jgi:hypothetical protein
MKSEKRAQVAIAGAFNGDIQTISPDPILNQILEQTEEGYKTLLPLWDLESVRNITLQGWLVDRNFSPQIPFPVV